MIPIIWRFLLSQYLKVMGLCTVAFVAVLLTTRLSEIAHFASLDPSEKAIFYFILYQIPYMLPIAFPISCLISSILLIQRLSSTHELTALRACGMSLREVLTPILLASAFISVGSFYVVSELATHSHLRSGLMKIEFRSINPLFLLHNKHLLKVKGAYFEVLGQSHLGEFARDVVIAMPNHSIGRLNLLIAKKLEARPATFVGQQITLISPLSSDKQQNFDPFIVENIGEAAVSSQNFSQILQQKTWDVHNDHLKMSLLLAQLNLHKSAMEENITEAKTKHHIHKKNINKGYSEIMRRLSAAIASFTFTLMGLSFGITISRRRSAKSLVYVIILAALFLSAYYTAKGVDHLLLTSSLFYFLPHIIIIVFSLGMLNRVSRGIGS